MEDVISVPKATRRKIEVDRSGLKRQRLAELDEAMAHFDRSKDDHTSKRMKDIVDKQYKKQHNNKAYQKPSQPSSATPKSSAASSQNAPKNTQHTSSEKKRSRQEKGRRRRKDKKLLQYVREVEEESAEAMLMNARAQIINPASEGFLEVENEDEKTWKFRQSEFKEAGADVRSMMLDLKFPASHGSYLGRYTRNGRHLLMGSANGHVGVVDCLRNTTQCEVMLRESIRDLCFLHDNSMFAVAQRKNVFIYDSSGSEVHRLRSHVQPVKLEYLPYHFLIVSGSKSGWLKWQDVSTGDLVCENRTKMGTPLCLRQNPANAVTCVGHSNGTVSMWSPAMSKPLVKMLCHAGPISTLAITPDGHNMITSSSSTSKFSIWDLRMYKKLFSYHVSRPVKDLDVSQTGMVAVGGGFETAIFKDCIRVKAKESYLKHQCPGEQMVSLRFRPFQDVLCYTTSSLKKGVKLSSLIIPGSGKANFDSFEADPFENKNRRKETQVKKLLDKIQWQGIGLNDDIGTIMEPNAENTEDKTIQPKENNPAKKEKKKMRGRGRIGRRIKRKHRNIITQEREKTKQMLEKEKLNDNVEQKEKDAFEALDRFLK